MNEGQLATEFCTALTNVLHQFFDENSRKVSVDSEMLIVELNKVLLSLGISGVMTQFGVDPQNDEAFTVLLDELIVDVTKLIEDRVGK